MKGILGRKLGMTQIFDPETGNVDAVTVIEAGPCPVVTVRTQAADGYEAVQLAFEPVQDRKLSRASSATSRRPASRATATSSSSAARASSSRARR